MDIITMPRGDLRGVNFNVYDASGAEVEKEFTQVTFTVKTSPNSRKIIVQKKLTDGTIKRNGNTYSLAIQPEDTDYLEYGTYYYDVELIRGDVLRQTFVGKLVLTEEITFTDDTEKGV